jgi:hypothetical protein
MRLPYTLLTFSASDSYGFGDEISKLNGLYGIFVSRKGSSSKKIFNHVFVVSWKLLSNVPLSNSIFNSVIRFSDKNGKNSWLM